MAAADQPRKRPFFPCTLVHLFLPVVSILQSMANLEAAIILAAICARFDLALAPGQVGMRRARWQWAVLNRLDGAA